MPDSAASNGSLDQTVSALVQVANLVIRRLGALFQKAGITPQQWAIVSLVATLDSPPTLAGIARDMMVSKQNVTGMISRLETLGLVTRSDDSSDLRATRIQLTRKGRQLHARIAPAYEEWVTGLFASLDLPERRALQLSLGALIQTLEAEKSA
jgi:DNA-binding MarR family transcriptional regulator